MFNGKLLALREDSPPVAMDPLTLETRGNWDFGGTLTSPTFTAHPKIDPETGQMIGFGYAAKGLFSRDTIYYEISPEGRITHEVWFEIPYHCMLHDFGVARDYVVFPIIPVCGVGIAALKEGKTHYAWDPSKPIYLGVLPRGGQASDLRWFKAPNQFCSHVMNAFNEETKVHIDVPRAEGNMFPFFPELGKPWDPTKAASRLTRWTVDMASNQDGFDSVTRLTDFVGEFPRNDDRYQMGPYRYGWLLGFEFTRNALGHVDLAKGKTSVWEAPLDTPLQELCFIPKSANAAEGEGYIVQAATRSNEMRTDVFLFDALRIEDGPIATIKVPLRLRPGSVLDAEGKRPRGTRRVHEVTRSPRSKCPRKPPAKLPRRALEVVQSKLPNDISLIEKIRRIRFGAPITVVVCQLDIPKTATRNEIGRGM